MTTIRKIITSSLGRLNAASANSVPLDEDIQVGLQALNGLIDSLSNNIQNIYTTTPYRFPLTNGQQTYKLGPYLDSKGELTGADWIVERPMRIENAVLVAYANISYPEPPPPSNTCNLKQCVLDDDAIALWHFNETDWPTINSVPGNNINGSGTSYQLQPDFGACEGSLWLSNQMYEEEFNLGYADQGLDPALNSVIQSRAQTHEMAITRNGSPAVPALFDYFDSYICTFNLFNYSEGSEAYITMKLVDHGYGPYWEFYKDGYQWLVDIFAPDEISWHSICIEYDFDEDVFFIFDNGTIIYSDYMSNLWSFGGSEQSVSGWWFSSGSACSIDECRQSPILRYDDNYDIYINPVTAVVQAEPIPPAPLPAVITENSGTLFLPLQLANYAQFSDITVRKLETTWPTTVYDNGAYPVRELSFWPVPTQVSLAVELWLWQPLATYETIDDELNLPPGYERYFILKLAMELAPEFGKNVTDVMRANLEEAEKMIKTLNQMTTVSEASESAKNLWQRGGSYARGSKVSNRIPRVW